MSSKGGCEKRRSSVGSAVRDRHPPRTVILSEAKDLLSFVRQESRSFASLRMTVQDGIRYLSLRAIQIRKIAPRVAVTILEINPPIGAKPTSRTRKPPTMAPTMPSAMSMSGPYPEPLMILPAAHPAIKPTRMTQSSQNISIPRKIVLEVDE